ncbi:MAG: hypothetical protein IPH13_05070 [Planctomycetes bacterium]|nr:hypothetical protein [Planctomycetota bacterium]MCC7170173.1 hypothetical protein [Planctomycetota bacterium]
MRSLRSLGLVALVVGIGAACAAAQDSGLAPVNPSPLAPKQDPASRLKQSGDAAKKADKPEKAAPTRRPMPVFVTFSQIDWAGPEANPRAKIALAKYFEEAFPEGLRVGVDEKGMKSFELKSLKAVRKFLPNGGKSGVLEDSSYESLEDCGSLAGHLVAAKINLRFNQRGFLGEPEEGVKNPLVMKEIKFKRGVDGNIQGMSVERLVKLCDRALAGEFGKPSDTKTDFIDTNNDDKKDVCLDDLRRALAVFNANFEDGENDGRFVAKGYTNDPPVAAATGAAAAGGIAAGAAGAADADEDEGDDRAKQARKEFEEANAERDRELDRAEAEHDDEIAKARVEARRARDPAMFEAKKAEIDAKFQRQKAVILKKHQEKLEKFRAKHGRLHPGKGNGLRLEGGERGADGSGRGNGKDKDGKGTGRESGG